jgi:transcriptional regulator with XRE-family HTH domain
LASPMIRYRTDGQDRQSPASYRPIASPGIVAAVACAFVVGTGGMSTPSYFQQRKECGYQFVQVRIAEGTKAGIRLPIEDLKQIRAVFKPSISDIANLLSVSRQTVYNWIAGERPSAESATRLEDLAKAADLLAAHGLSTNAYLFTRKIRDGKNLMDIATDGGSAEGAARSLVRIVEQENAQRNLLNHRLAGRKYAGRDNSEFGVPMLDENVGS